VTLYIKKYGHYAYLTSTQTRYDHMAMFTPPGFVYMICFDGVLYVNKYGWYAYLTPT